jgi:aryl-alcohol dehydrogenase-like predicted oxidoreductase
MTDTPTASATAETFALGGERSVHRLGYGSMQLTGPGVWGEPRDHAEAIRVLRRAVELGVDFIDTADSYGPFVAEDLIHEALYPYDGVTIATKGGFTRTGPGEWHAVGRPEYLRQCVEMSLRRLGIESIELYQLHRIDPQVPLEEQLGALKDMQIAGKIRYIGLSEVSVEEIEAARRIVDLASVQNLYNLVNRSSEPVLEYCEREQIAFIPWFPIATGELARGDGPLTALATEIGASPPQVALAWLLRRSPVMLPIPGTSSVEHLEENMGAAGVALSDAQFSSLAGLTTS